MDAMRWSRWSAVSGIIFAVAFIVGMMLLDLPSGGESNEAVTEFYADSGNRVGAIVSSYILVVAGLAFLVFLAGLHRGLRRAEGDSGSLATIALGAGIVFVAMLYSGSSAFGNVPGGVEFGGEAQPSSEIPVWFTQLGYGDILMHAMWAAIAVIVPASLLALRTGVLPRWLAWTGFACAPVLMLGVMFIPMVALPVWVIAASVSMLKETAAQPVYAAQPAPTSA